MQKYYKGYKSFLNFGPLRSTSFAALKDIKLILDKKIDSYIMAEGLHASISTLFLPKKYSKKLFLMSMSSFEISWLFSFTKP